MTSPQFNNKMVEILFNLRSSMTRGIKNNFPSFFKGNMSCKLNCQESETIDCQEHILSCKKLISSLSIEQQATLKEVIYLDIFGCTEKQQKIVNLYVRLLEIREEILESLPMGNDIGPSITVTPI